MVISRTSYRLSLFGGGSDFPAWFRLHGGSCLAAAIDKSCWVSARWLPPFFPHKTRVVWSKIELVKERSDIEHPAVRAALEMLDLDGVEIHHDGDLPARSGIGSSSAFAVGLLHALHGLHGEMVAPERLAAEATHLEQDLLHEPVGNQDQLICALGGFRLITFERDGTWRADPVILPPERVRQLEDRLMLFYTGPRQEAPMPSIADEWALHEIQKMPAGALSFLEAGAWDDFGELLHQAWYLKRRLAPGITTPEVDALYDAARRAGARGGKLLGAGGGGFLLLFAEPQFQNSVLRALDGCVPIPFRFAARGSEIAYFRPEARS